MDKAREILQGWTPSVEGCGDLLEIILMIEPYLSFLEKCNIPFDAVVLGVRIPRVQ